MRVDHTTGKEGARCTSLNPLDGDPNFPEPLRLEVYQNTHVPSTFLESGKGGPYI